jgi:2-methylaconitate cis-trans-isomerase PrpF
MKILTVKDMIRKDVPIYYRKLYTGVAVIDVVETSKGPVDYRIDFSIEYKPTGQKDIAITFIDSVDYPLIPLNRELKKYISELDSAGGLPD